MKLHLLLICTLCCLSLTGQAETTPATSALSDAAKDAVQEAITAAKTDLELKTAAAAAALNAKAEAEKARDAKESTAKDLKAQVDKETEAQAKQAAQVKFNGVEAELKELRSKADEQARAAEAAVKAKITAENKLNGLLGTGSATDNPLTLGNDRIYQASLAALTKIFVVAVLLESGLALLFTWSVFLAFLNRRAWRPVIMFFAALILVWGFDLDIVAQLIAIYNATPAGNATVTGFASWASMFISATVLAGGSAGVFNMMAALGFRSKQERDSSPPPPGADQAWVSIRLTRFNGATHNIKVNIDEITDTSKLPTPPPAATAGTISGKTPTLGDLFMSIKDRFPPTAGYTVKAGTYYKIQVMDGDKDLLEDKGFYKFAPRAIVDLVVPYPA